MIYSSTLKCAVFSLGLGLILAPAVSAQVAIIDANSRRGSSQQEGHSAATPYPDPSSGAVSYPADGGGSSSPTSSGSVSSSSPVSAGGSQGDLFNRLLTLEDEVMKLRGVVEEQNHQIEQLKQQRTEDYQSLDKRISESSAGRGQLRGAVVAHDGDAINAAADPMASAPAELTSSAEGEQAYQQAYALINAKKYPEARVAFEKFLKKYPNDAMTPNAMYWLGQLYLIEANDDAAMAEYTKLIGKFPDNRKAPEAMFKLAQIHYEKGNKTKSKALLNGLISKYGDSGSPAVGLAKDYLKQNF